MHTWDEFFNHEKEKPYYQELMNKVEDEYQNYTVYPPREQMFSAFELTPFCDVKVVIVGQDPYHNPLQANGLAFSVNSNIKLPPSLKNIYKEIENEYGIKMKNDGDLTYLAKQGVLLINASLSVRENKPMSHAKMGYEELLKNILLTLSNHKDNLVFVLWGAYARNLKKYIDEKKHLILESAHPSPLSAYHGFFFNNHFKMINEYLNQHQFKEINWNNN